MKCAALILCVLCFVLPSSAHQKDTKTYPEHGIVVAIRDRNVKPGMILGGGLTVAIQRGSYRVETKEAFYEFEERGKHPTLSLNQKIDFRVDHGNAYVEEPKGKEKRYKIIGEESRRSGNP